MSDHFPPEHMKPQPPHRVPHDGSSPPTYIDPSVPMPKPRQKSKKPTRKVFAQYVASAIVMLIAMIASSQLGIDVTPEDLAGLETIIAAVLTAIGLPGIGALVSYFVRPSPDDQVVQDPY